MDAGRDQEQEGMSTRAQQVGAFYFLFNRVEEREKLVERAYASTRAQQVGALHPTIRVIIQ